ncbi:AraC-like ligand-binding domain-containing protein [Microbacterium lacticum]
MNDRRPTTDAAHPSLGFDAFRAAVVDSVVALDVHAEDPDAFHGTLCGQTSGDVLVMGIDASAHSVHRTAALIGRNPQHNLKFTVVEHGSGLIVQDGRETTLAAGDMTLYDTDRPYSLLCGDDTRISVVMFPKELLLVPADRVAMLTATRVDGTAGVGALVRPFLSGLAQQLDALDSRAGRRLSRSATELISAVLEAEPGARASFSTRGALMGRIQAYIDENLSSPELSPPAIAAAHFISVRHLHALFSDQGTTVSTVIRNRRLERCYDRITDPACATLSVSTIAMDNGFMDAAHFSRTFRAHYGVPPSAVRGAAG